MKSKKHAGRAKASKNASHTIKIRMPIELFAQLKKAAGVQARTVNNMAVFFLARGVTHLESLLRESDPEEKSEPATKRRPSTK